MTPLKERDRLRLERAKKAGAKREITGMSKRKEEYNLKDMSFEVKFTMDEEGLRGLAAFLKEQDEEILDAIFRGKQGLILRDPKRGTAELSHVVRCKNCFYQGTVDCPMDEQYADDYCSYGARKEQDHE